MLILLHTSFILLFDLCRYYFIPLNIRTRHTDDSLDLSDYKKIMYRVLIIKQTETNNSIMCIGWLNLNRMNVNLNILSSAARIARYAFYLQTDLTAIFFFVNILFFIFIFFQINLVLAYKKYGIQKKSHMLQLFGSYFRTYISGFS